MTILKKRYKNNLARHGHLHRNHLVLKTDSRRLPVPRHSDMRGMKQLFPLHCPAGVNFFNIPLQVEDISPVIFF